MFRDWNADANIIQINKDAVCGNMDTITFMVELELKKLPDTATTIVSICVPGNWINPDGTIQVFKNEYEVISIEIDQYGAINYDTHKNDGKHVVRRISTIDYLEQSLKPSTRYTVLIQHSLDEVQIIINGNMIKNQQSGLEKPIPTNWSSVKTLINSSKTRMEFRGEHGFEKQNLTIHKCRIFSGCVNHSDIDITEAPLIACE